jgi:hypothetical protein
MRKIWLWTITWVPLSAQVYLVTGSASEKYNDSYAAAAVEIDSGGLVKPVFDIVPDGVGMSWATISHDLGKAVFLTKFPDDRIIVLDIDKGTVVKSCLEPKASDMGTLSQWLANVPGRGAVLAEYMVGNDLTSRSSAFRAMSLDEAVPCENSFAPLRPDELKYVEIHGYTGVAGTGGYDFMDVGLDSDGSLRATWRSGEQTYFDYRVPRTMVDDIKAPVLRVVINNQQLFAVSVIGTAGEVPRLLVLRKRDMTWERVPDPNGLSSMRGFGRFIALTELQRKDKELAESAGRTEWRKSEAKYGPNVEERMKDAANAYPGRLRIYDAEKEKLDLIVTNQGDSEILLIEDGVVYYRASDRLYSVAITDAGVSGVRLLATSDLVRDAHWAFVKR